MEEQPSIPIAIIGMSCRFAGGATDPEKLWKLCAEGKSGWREFPEDRFNIKGHYHPRPDNLNTTNVKGACFLNEDVGAFDATFFGLPAELAACLDPQFRLILESTYEAFENAGLSMQEVTGSNTSVYGGTFFKDYRDGGLRDLTSLPRSFLIGVGEAMASNRVSHYYDLRGASMSIDTGCSTTLTALHQACNDLRHKESNMSVVTGANLMLNPDMFITMSSISLISKDGRSFTFDSRANGYGRGEGVATVVLKRLDDAIRDGDPIQAVIKESALNQDGKTDTITTPSQNAQIELIKRVYKKAGLDPKDTGFFETHGTGTPTGDPLEVGAVAAVFQNSRPRDQPLRIGSIKPNVGHCECASGLASIVKTVKALEKGLIPPVANLENINPKLKLVEWNLKIPRTVETWPENTLRRASVNNFGYGGANAHVILEQYTPPQLNGHHTQATSLPSKVFMVSAKDEGAAKAMVANLRDHLTTVDGSDEATYLNDLAYTLGQRRSVFPWTAAISASSMANIVEIIDAGRMKARRAGNQPRLGFVFTGQGAQWYAMGRELITAYPIFRETLEEAARYLKDFGATYDLLEELHKDEQSTRVNDAALGQPVCVAVQIALVRLLDSFGIRPTAVTSHSSGEIASAYAAGALSLRSAMGVVYARGSLAADIKKYSTLGMGGMIAVGLGDKAAEQYITRVTAGKVVVACKNSPASVTVSGDMEGIDEIEKLLKADNIFARKLKVPTGYHSHHMEPIAEAYAAWMREHVTAESQLNGTIYSSPTTGHRMTSAAEIAAPEHWVKSLTQPVLFVESFTNMCFAEIGHASDVDMVLEIGAHGALGGPIKEIQSLDAFEDTKLTYVSALTRKKNAVETIQTLACELLHQGFTVDMGGVNLTRRGHVLTDLPKYAWSHATRHWYEPRINRAHRLKSEPLHDLLGQPVAGTNRINPSWRHVIKPSAMPWITDHKLQGTVVYPGAGFIAMAIEGLVQAEHNNTKNIQGFRLRDIDILQALVIPEGEEGIEVQLSLKPCSEKTIHAKGYKEFSICSVTHDDSWAEHCRGIISIEYDNARAALPTASIRDAGDYRLRISPSDIYASMHRVGIQHGPIFQNLKSVRGRPQESFATIEIVDTAAIMPYKAEHSHVIHPTTLDTVFQAIYGALPAAGANMATAQVPRSIRSLWVSNTIRHAPGSLFNTYSSVRDSDTQGFKASVSVVDGENDDIVITIDDFRFQSIGSASNAGEPCQNEKFMSPKWVPDLTLMSTTLLKERLACDSEPVEAEALADLQLVCTWFMEDALAALSPADVERLQGHLKRYYVWMKQQVARNARSKGQDNPSLINKIALINKIGSRSVNGELVCNLGPHLASILRGEVSPLALMEEGQLLYRFYAEGLKLDRSRKQVAELVHLYAHKYPRCKVLEIGAGSGGTTAHVLGALGTEEPLAASYDYTDVSDTFFETAKEDFQAWSDLISFKTLDVEQVPVTQDFEAGAYDLIIASQVLHRTRSIDDTIANLRKLMKPGGKLVIMESTKDQLDYRLTFGLLSDQWLGEEEHRLLSPLLSVTQWDDSLKRNGFNGVEVDVRDCESEELYTYSVMMSGADQAPSRYGDVVIALPRSAPSQEWVDTLSNSLGSIVGTTPMVQSYDTIDCDGKLVVFVGELSDHILTAPDDAQFEAIRSMCTKSKGLLWVTRGGAVESSDPFSALAQGFLRIIRLEYVGKPLGNLDLDLADDAFSASSVASIAKVFSQLFADGPLPREYEWAVRNGSVNILRYFKENEANKLWFPDSSEAMPTQQKQFTNCAPIRLTSSGTLESLVFAPIAPLETDISGHEIEIAPKAFGISTCDVNAAAGTSDNRQVGFECAGVVTNVGSSASSEGFRIGDRVASLIKGDLSNIVRVPWTSVVRIPDDMGFEQAAALPMAYVTAWISLVDTARLGRGETVLIHHAGSAVGQAATAIARHFGAEVFATVGSFEQASFLRRVLGITPDHIYLDSDATFAAKVLKHTRTGVDVVLNTLEGALLQESLNCLAPLGRFVELGKRDAEQNSSLEMGAFARGISLSAIDVAMFVQHKARQVNRALNSVFDLVKSKAINGVLTSVHDISDVVQAFRNAQKASSPASTVLSVKRDSTVAVIRQTPSVKLRPDASYVVVGGFGGIGQSVCLWLAERGAKHLIVLSRSANAGAKAAPLFAELEKMGCHLKPIACDIADEASLVQGLESCRTDMPPVRGVIQGAMVLRDSIIEQMSLLDYNTGLRPKVQGTWNLHKAFMSTPLDFFVILSSAAGVIGIASQCNYGAGGSFQDALSKWRTTHGMPCVSIDVGAVKGVGVVAEHDSINAYLVKSGHMLLSEGDVLNAIERAVTDPYGTQLVFGINLSPNSALWTDGPAGRDLRFWPGKYRSTDNDAMGDTTKADDLAGKLARAKTLEEAGAAVASEIVAKIMDIFMIPEEEVDPSKPMAEFGVDSLTAVELRNALAMKAGAEVSIFDIMQSRSLSALAASIAGKSMHLSPVLAAEPGLNARG